MCRLLGERGDSIAQSHLGLLVVMSEVLKRAGKDQMQFVSLLLYQRSASTEEDEGEEYSRKVHN